MVTLFAAPPAADRVRLLGPPPPTQPALTDSSADALAINKTFPTAALNRRTYHKRDFRFLFVPASGLACVRNYWRESMRACMHVRQQCTCEGLCMQHVADACARVCLGACVCICVYVRELWCLHSAEGVLPGVEGSWNRRGRSVQGRGARRG